jgi:hypothetical protein
MGSFDKSDWNWQIEQFQRRVSEWLEANFFPAAEKVIRSTDWTISDWVINATIWLAWAILGSAIAWMIWQIFKVIRPYLETIGWIKIRNSQTEKLPISPPAIEWEQRSQNLAARGEYREACRALYMAMLQRLHESALAPQQPSRTDGEYLHLLRHIPRWQSYQVLLNTHERLCFNDEMLSVNTFERCQQAYQELEHYLSSNRS